MGERYAPRRVATATWWRRRRGRCAAPPRSPTAAPPCRGRQRGSGTAGRGEGRKDEQDDRERQATKHRRADEQPRSDISTKVVLPRHRVERPAVIAATPPDANSRDQQAHVGQPHYRQHCQHPRTGGTPTSAAVAPMRAELGACQLQLAGSRLTAQLPARFGGWLQPKPARRLNLARPSG